jgi:hypothetical protein
MEQPYLRGDLATIGNVPPQTASSHRAKLVQGKLRVAEEKGRHRLGRWLIQDVVGPSLSGTAIQAIAKPAAGVLDARRVRSLARRLKPSVAKC